MQLDKLLDRKPGQLSGGQRQRVAIGRAIVRDPRVFLFDEPLSNLDAELRVQMRVEIAKLHNTLGNTMIYVTHDQTEALTLADRIVVLRAGVIEQVGSPLELYDNPSNSFVAGFIGSPRMNFLSGKGLPGNRIAAGGIEFVSPVAIAEGAAITVGIRPEHLDEAVGTALALKVEVVERLGSTAYVHGVLSTGETVVAEQRSATPGFGDRIAVHFDPTRIRLFDAAGLRLR